ncbi:hypothetical protein [Paraburkholderia atlantica]|uniref:hypothetical protein n=1 Tax=Paraburkholderia atlantica TaxID=2654982 RepID=UPI000381A398|nr:hypothetical protein [Paraburkholderia atlantica]
MDVVMNGEVTELRDHAFACTADANARKDAESTELSAAIRCEAATRARVAISHQRLLRQRALVHGLAVGGVDQSIARHCLRGLEDSFHALSLIWEMRLHKLDALLDSEAR